MGATELVNHDERDVNDLTPAVAAPDASSCLRAGEMTDAKVLSALSVSAASVNDFKTRSSWSKATSPKSVLDCRARRADHTLLTRTFSSRVAELSRVIRSSCLREVVSRSSLARRPPRSVST